jgi:tetratricopeptide (TPR) repeat protein
MIRTASPTTPPPSLEARRLARQAHLKLEAREYPAALALFRQAWDSGGRDHVAYNAACAAALAGERDEAFQWLERALAAGFDRPRYLEEDADLAALRGDPAFAQAVRQAEVGAERTAAVIQQPELAREIIEMAEVDQEIRSRWGPAAVRGDVDPALTAELQAVDERNTTRMRDIMAAHGWPGRSLVGQQATFCAWLLVQHADQDHAFQKQCLIALEKAVAEGEASPENYAYLFDRIQVAEDKPQRYGTQFQHVDGELVPEPIEDPEHVDDRRLAIGLMPLEEYARLLRQRP